VKSDSPGSVQSDYPGFASATAKDGEQIAKEQGARPRAKEQCGEVTGDDENAREGLAKPGQRKTDLNLVFSRARPSLQSGLALFTGNQIAQSWLPIAWWRVKPPNQTSP
jgi:hypothetical protein